MRMQTVATDVASNVESKTFNIIASPKAFKILSSGLYTNKIGSIVREITFNAIDAHVAAKNDAPVRVHLPTKLDPVFKVEDDGVGLDEREVNEILSTFFASTKTESDDLVGAFGLGFKSPFSYVDAFVVSCRKNGVKSTYACVVSSELGVPSISKMSTEEWSGPNGVTVEIPVMERDIDNFRHEVLRQLVLVRNKIDVVDEDDLFCDVATPRSCLEYDVYQTSVSQSLCQRLSGQSYYCEMGGVLYPYSTSVFGANSVAGYDKVVLKFRLGEIEPSASREDLQYTQKTLDAFSEKIQRIEADLKSVASWKIDEYKSVEELAATYSAARKDPSWPLMMKHYAASFEHFFMKAHHLHDRNMSLSLEVGGKTSRIAWSIQDCGRKISKARKNTQLSVYDSCTGKKLDQEGKIYYGDVSLLRRVRAHCNVNGVKNAYFVADPRLNESLHGDGTIDASTIDPSTKFVPAQKVVKQKKPETFWVLNTDKATSWTMTVAVLEHAWNKIIEVEDWSKFSAQNKTYVVVRSSKVHRARGKLLLHGTEQLTQMRQETHAIVTLNMLIQRSEMLFGVVLSPMIIVLKENQTTASLPFDFIALEDLLAKYDDVMNENDPIVFDRVMVRALKKKFDSLNHGWGGRGNRAKQLIKAMLNDEEAVRRCFADKRHAKIDMLIKDHFLPRSAKKIWSNRSRIYSFASKCIRREFKRKMRESLTPFETDYLLAAAGIQSERDDAAERLFAKLANK